MASRTPAPPIASDTCLISGRAGGGCCKAKKKKKINRWLWKLQTFWPGLPWSFSKQFQAKRCNFQSRRLVLGRILNKAMPQKETKDEKNQPCQTPGPICELAVPYVITWLCRCAKLALVRIIPYQIDIFAYYTVEPIAALPTNPPECSHRVWSRNGWEGCFGMLHDVITQMVHFLTFHRQERRTDRWINWKKKTLNSPAGDQTHGPSD